MKIIKKIAAIMLSVMMVLGMCSVVGAEETSGTSAKNDGKITITNAVPKQTYTIYRILELESFSDKTETAENSGNYAYKATTKWKGFVESTTGKKYLKTDDSGYVTWVESTDPAAFAKAALAYAKDSTNPIKAEESKPAPDATDGSATSTVTFEKLGLGYYLVDSSVGALCSLDTTAKEVEIKEKNGVPSVKKEVQEDSKGNSNDAWGNENTADIGQTVNFKTTITAQAGAQNYVLHDKMDAGLTFKDNVQIQWIKKSNNTTTSLTNGTEYDVTTTDLETTDPKCTFHVTFKQDFCDKLAKEDTIVITYSATLNEKAVIAKEGNKNETWLKYGDNNVTTHETTTTKTYEIPVFKYTEKTVGDKTGLPNAEFTLSKNEKGTNPITLVDITATGETDKTYRVATEIEKTTTSNKTKTMVTTPSTGKFKIQGLDADTYYLTETKQPDGYNKLSAPVKIVIKEDGTITIGESADTVDEVKVENKSGSILPNTGGMGTTLFYIFGAILVIGSGVVLITKKRMK